MKFKKYIFAILFFPAIFVAFHSMTSNLLFSFLAAVSGLLFLWLATFVLARLPLPAVMGLLASLLVVLFISAAVCIPFYFLMPRRMAAFVHLFIFLGLLYPIASWFLARWEDVVAFLTGKEGSWTGQTKLLDTSVIIDGRIKQLLETGFIEGNLVIPGFVVAELQKLADSTDPKKRSRGRLGLEILEELKKKYFWKLKIVEKDYPRVRGVDNKMVKMAAELKAPILTTDYNLNKVAKVKGVKVLNINELAEALRPIYLPGEELEVEITRKGKDQTQGVAHLQDGTMVVVEGGGNLIGRHVRVVVTSVLQTASGKIIFTRVVKK